MMNMNLLQKQILELLEKELHLAVPAVETDLFEAGIMDSLVFVDLLVQLERVFRINIDMEQIEIEDFKSVEAISIFVNRQLPYAESASRDRPQLSVAM